MAGINIMNYLGSGIAAVSLALSGMASAQSRVDKPLMIAPGEIAGPIDFEASPAKLLAVSTIDRGGKAVGAMALSCSLNPKSVSLAISLPEDIPKGDELNAWVRISNEHQDVGEVARAKGDAFILQARSNSVSPEDASAYALAPAYKVQMMLRAVAQGGDFNVDIVTSLGTSSERSYGIKVSTAGMGAVDRKKLQELADVCGSLKFE